MIYQPTFKKIPYIFTAFLKKTKKRVENLV